MVKERREVKPREGGKETQVLGLFAFGGETQAEKRIIGRKVPGREKDRRLVP